jgi:sodium transport system permease protein
MKHIFTIYRKELKDTIRDRRALIRMIIIPLAVFPLITSIVSTIAKNAASSEQERALRIGYYAGGEDLGLRDALKKVPDFEIVDVTIVDSLKPWIRANRLDGGVSVDDGFAQVVRQMGRDTIRTYGPRASEIVNDRIEDAVDAFIAGLLKVRLDSLHLTKESIEPAVRDFKNTAEDRETIGKLAGGFLPYIFIIFCYTGCLFPAIDLFTGEKERGTIETLLSSPIEKWKILVGKMMLIVTAGLMGAALSIAGLVLSLKIVDNPQGELIKVALNIATPSAIVALLSMLLPLVVFFAGIMIPATVYSKTFKEAVITLQPLNFVVLIPAMIGMFPGIDMNALTAAIPILNVVLMTKEIIAGTMNGWLFVEVLASLFLLAGVAVALSFRGFGNEKNVLR